LHSSGLISVDWGTSAFRAYLFGADGTTIDVRKSALGILSVPAGRYEATLAEAIGEWRDRDPGLPILMSGMVGARQGWREAPYAACPAGLFEIGAAIVAIDGGALGPIGLVPGVRRGDADPEPDVMRGEETQILGALAWSGRADGTLVLPGTHSKWARVVDGRIRSFSTYMTGEIFAALKGHTILGCLMNDGRGSGEGFEEGVRAATRLSAPGDLLHAVFMTRSLGLFDRLSANELSDYLSGLLIGAEVLAGSAGAPDGAIIVGSPDLTERYMKAGASLGVKLRAAPGDCVSRGHLALLDGWRARAL
jgi:2-dehydro-3-deoxygalactonokinase